MAISTEKDSIICKNCGNRSPPFNYCSNCGLQLAGERETAQSDVMARRRIQLLVSALETGSEELDKAKILLLGKFKRYPETFQEIRLRILAIVTFLIPSTLGFRDFPELIFLRPFLLLIVILLVGFGILIFFVFESKKRAMNDILYKIDSGYNIVTSRIYAIRGFLMGLTLRSTISRNIDFLVNLAAIIMTLRMEMSDATRAASGSELLSTVDRKNLLQRANGLDSLMRKTYQEAYRPNKEEIEKFCDQLKEEIPLVAEALFVFQKRYSSPDSN
jgi:hypothetical protein